MTEMSALQGVLLTQPQSYRHSWGPESHEHSATEGKRDAGFHQLRGWPGIFLARKPVLFPPGPTGFWFKGSPQGEILHLRSGLPCPFGQLGIQETLGTALAGPVPLLNKEWPGPSRVGEG